MATEVKFLTKKTYATRANARAAVARVIPPTTDLRFFIHQNEEGRYLPVFLGEQAVQLGVHFHFSVVA